MRSIDIIAATAAIVLCILLAYHRRTLSHLPPGPRPLPLVGNLFNIPKHHAWAQYAAWAKEYGDVVSLSIPGQVIVVLNSHEALKNLLQSRSTVFSGRPSVKFSEMAGWQDKLLVLMPYGRSWRDRRRIVDHFFRPSAVDIHQPVQCEKVRQTMRRFIERPDDMLKHLRQHTSAVIMSVIYGYEVRGSSDKFVRIVEDMNALGSRTLLPGSLLINTFPFLAYLPLWVLGPGFTSMLHKSRVGIEELLYAPYQWLKASVARGSAKQCLAYDSVNINSSSDETDRLHAEAFGSIFSAAADTSVAILSTFFLAMVLYPEVQKRAQQEIDSVVEQDRMPGFQDRPNLPFISALLLEVIRWQPVLPLGVPHAAEEGTMLGSVYVPKGAIIIGNAWAVLQDPVAFPEPSVFKPERHLSFDGKIIEDPLLEHAFGFGTRKCPGRYFADAALWIFMVSILAGFNISHALDERGNKIPVNPEYDTFGITRHPMPFKCSVSLRGTRLREN